MSSAAERLEADKALAAAVRDRILAVLDELEAQEIAKCEPHDERRWKYTYAAYRLRQAKQLIIEGDIK